MRFQRLHQNGVSGREVAELASELILPLQPMEKIVAVAKTMIAATIGRVCRGSSRRRRSHRTRRRRSRAREVQAKAEDAGGEHARGEGHKLAQRRSR